MSKKHITIKELNNEGIYDTLYPNTSATQVPLSDATSQLFGQSGLNTDAALYKIIEKLSTDKKITVRVTDSNGNPVQGAKINGLLNSPTTSANGTVTGVFVSDPLTIISPYVDIQDGTANGADYVGTINVLEVVLQAEADNTIFRYTSSTNVVFSQGVNTIDICCVGGGGAGQPLETTWSSTQAITYNGGGGGGGGIVNSFSVPVTANTSYSVVVGSGGLWDSSVITSVDPGNKGGDSSFMGVVAPGGNGGYKAGSAKGGAAGISGCGDGGNGGRNGGSNTTISEFNDGVTFYSGGGGGSNASGGSPYGANGATSNSNAGSARGYGGGGGAKYQESWSSGRTNKYGSSGGNGLVAIRIHLK